MPSITNVGGSLTSALILTLLAWGVRWVRSQALKQKGGDGNDKRKNIGRFFSRLSPAALRMLVETDPVLHLLFDVRGKDVSDASPLPPQLKRALQLDAGDIQAVLGPGCGWRERFPGLPQPHPDTTLVLLTDTEEQGLDAAAAAAAEGYQRVAILQGGLPGWAAAEAAGRLTAPDLHYIQRDALALLLGLVPDAAAAAAAGNGNGSYGAAGGGGGGPGWGGGAEGSGWGVGAGAVRVVDLRRADERTLYGSIPGTVHLPADQLASALALAPDQFRAAYRFAKPQGGDPLVLCCRTNKAASWAAVLAADAGLRHCLVYKQGVYGWRLSPGVKVYRQYGVTDPPPEPEDVPLECVDVDAACRELQDLGLPFML